MKRNWLIIPFTAPIRAYKALISPVLGSNCRFYPTCSTYTLQAFERHGVLKGLYLGSARMLKCNPYCRCDYHDPVPEEFKWSALASNLWSNFVRRIDWLKRISYNRLVHWKTK